MLQVTDYSNTFAFAVIFTEHKEKILWKSSFINQINFLTACSRTLTVHKKQNYCWETPHIQKIKTDKQNTQTT